MTTTTKKIDRLADALVDVAEDLPEEHRDEFLEDVASSFPLSLAGDAALTLRERLEERWIEEEGDPDPPYILCAANWYPTATTVAHQPVNVPNGVVVAGHRHSSIYPATGYLVGDASWPDFRKIEKQGFLTSDNRWVDRVEGFQIAKAADQLNWDEVHRRGGAEQLYSEDLY